MAALEAEGISKVTLVVFAHNEKGNAFWERLGFTLRDDLIYRNKSIRTAVRMDT
jgi:ribosomal protein S18 acetylase RimI-like enzyme